MWQLFNKEDEGILTIYGYYFHIIFRFIILCGYLWIFVEKSFLVIWGFYWLKNRKIDDLE